MIEICHKLMLSLDYGSMLEPIPYVWINLVYNTPTPTTSAKYLGVQYYDLTRSLRPSLWSRSCANQKTKKEKANSSRLQMCWSKQAAKPGIKRDGMISIIIKERLFKQ